MRCPQYCLCAKFASCRGLSWIWRSRTISFDLILSLLTNDNYPSDKSFSFVLESFNEAEDYHANSTILPIPQIYAKHAIISISIFSAQCGPDTHPLTVNNVSVRQDQVPLHDGDIIVIGEVKLKFACGVK